MIEKHRIAKRVHMHSARGASGNVYFDRCLEKAVSIVDLCPGTIYN